MRAAGTDVSLLAMLTSWPLRALLACALLFAVSLSMVPDRSEQDPARERPNIILILTDDQPAKTLAEMPKLREGLMDQGVTFKQGFVTDPLCCPSRATILTGEYAHNHGVRTNSFPGGGAEKFRELDGDTIATRLQEAGYSTAYFGKYFNEYRGRYVPPGWDRWFVYSGTAADRSYDINDQGRVLTYTHAHTNETDLTADRAAEYIGEHDGPWFMVVGTRAPHGPHYSSDNHRNDFNGVDLPGFGEEDVADKPAIVRNAPPLDEKRTRRLREDYEGKLETLQDVDDLVGKLLKRLEATGQMNTTYIVYTTDNGWLLGEHNLTAKGLPYEGAIRVPYVVRGPGVPPDEKRDELVANVDLAPTFAAWGGVELPGADGRELAPLLEDAPSASWRERLLIEHFAGHAWEGLRTPRYTYAEHATGEKELYDLREDPRQLRNVYKTADQALLENLERRLELLRDCSGDGCRAAEGD
jgi:N-acetylglucosamine-6-sulfatase